MLKEQTVSQSVEERFIVRPPQMSDLEDVLEMLEISDLTTMGEIEASANGLQTDWTNPKVDRERNCCVVTTRNGRSGNKRVVGYGQLFDTLEPFIQSWLWSRVHPEFEGQGIGSYLLNWGENLTCQSIGRAPKGARVTMDAGIVSTYRPAIDLLEGFGMSLKRHFYTMMMELDGNSGDPILPDNIVIRPMRDNDELTAVVRAMDEGFRDHWGYVEGSFESELDYWQHFIEVDPRYDRELWFLAVDGDEIVGVSLCSPEYGADPNMGWVNELCIRPSWRRQGIALALLKQSFGELYRRGKNRVGLGVDADSLTGATRLYEKAGMHAARRFDVYEKELRPGVDLARRTIE